MYRLAKRVDFFSNLNSAKMFRKYAMKNILFLMLCSLEKISVRQLLQLVMQTRSKLRLSILPPDVGAAGGVAVLTKEGLLTHNNHLFYRLQSFNKHWPPQLNNPKCTNKFQALQQAVYSG